MKTLQADLVQNDAAGLRALKSLFVPDALNAVLWIRLYLWFERRGLPTFLSHRVLLHLHGLEFARKVRIGPGLYLPHPRGVLFAESTHLGSRVAVYGNVRFLRKNGEAPTIGDGVSIGDGAQFVGATHIGAGTKVGAGAVVTRSFPERSVIAGNPAKLIRTLVAAENEGGHGSD